MSISAFEHPVLSGLFGDDEIGAIFSFELEINLIVRFEVALTKALFEAELVSKIQCDAILDRLEQFVPNVENLHERIRQDGVIIPALVGQMREELEPETAKMLHFGATSQDVIDSVQMLRLYQCLDLFEQRLCTFITTIDYLDESFGANVIMARTRMQVALPQSVSQKLMQWRMVVLELKSRTEAIRLQKPPLSFGGPVGICVAWAKRLKAFGPQLRRNWTCEMVPVGTRIVCP